VFRLIVGHLPAARIWRRTADERGLAGPKNVDLFGKLLDSAVLN